MSLLTLNRIALSISVRKDDDQAAVKEAHLQLRYFAIFTPLCFGLNYQARYVRKHIQDCDIF